MSGPSREEKVRLFDQIVRTTPDLIWMFSADWTELLYLNEGYEELWGWSRETLATDPSDFLEGGPPGRSRGRRGSDGGCRGRLAGGGRVPRQP